MKRYPWWKWPQTDSDPDYAPWYLIAWRAFWLIPQTIVSWTLIAIVFIGWGPKTAKSIADEILYGG